MSAPVIAVIIAPLFLIALMLALRRAYRFEEARDRMRAHAEAVERVRECRRTIRQTWKEPE